jgi:hypothetical protein
MRSYKWFSSTDSRLSPDTLQVSVEENWAAVTLLSVYLLLKIKVDFRTINCYMQIGVKIVPTLSHNINSTKDVSEHGYEISLEKNEF